MECKSHRGSSWKGKGSDEDDDHDVDDKDSDHDQVVCRVSEEQWLCGDRGDGAQPIGLPFQVRELHCPGIDDDGGRDDDGGGDDDDGGGAGDDGNQSVYLFKC